MMAVFLKEPDIIGGIPRNAGELVIVPDDYDQDNIRQTVRRNIEKFHEDERREKERQAKEKKAERERVRKDKPDKPNGNGGNGGGKNGRQ